MKINHIKKGALEYIYIEDFYNDSQLKDVNEEIRKLVTYTTSAKDTDPAIDVKTNKPLKNGEGLWLDDHYTKYAKNPIILKYNYENLDTKTIETLKKFNAFYGHFEMSNFNFTLLNAYRNKQHYKPHKDGSVLSAIIFLKIGDFSGGDFSFPDYNEIVPFKENTMVIFPGCVTHEALPILTEDNKTYRISVVIFINYNLTRG